MTSDTVENYVLAGLDSHLLNNGKVRLFTSERDTQDAITPHSHRFDFVCLVLKGSVNNKIWSPATSFEGDEFQVSTLDYSGEIGQHTVQFHSTGHWNYKARTYFEGQVYSMTSEQIHSIEFSRGAAVLFFEGPTKTNTSLILEPLVKGRKIPTYVKRDWMFV